MKAIGVHTYLGAFQKGLEGHLEVLGSAETWPRALQARSAAGDDSVLNPAGPLPTVDLVFANPPCSRFSHAATYHYDAEQLSKLSHFHEMQEVVSVVDHVGAKVAWWETGPLCATLGVGMVRSIHDALSDMWGGATTMLVRHELRAAGVPQARPRCHVLHLAGEHLPRVLRPEGMWPPDFYEGVGRWTRERRGHEDGAGLPCPPRDGVIEDDESVVETCTRLRAESSFSQGVPRIVSRYDGYALVVLSGRRFAWGEEDRWWTVEELASLMGYPPAMARAVGEAHGPSEALTMLSKGVCGHAGADVWTRCVKPTLEKDAAAGQTNVEDLGGGVHEVDLTVPKDVHRALPRTLSRQAAYYWQAPSREDALSAIAYAIEERNKLKEVS